MKVGPFNTVADVNKFFAGRKILVTGSHDWSGEVTDFECMVLKTGKVPADTDKPTVDLRMRVKTKFSTTLDLKQENVFVIDKVMQQQPSKN